MHLAADISAAPRLHLKKQGGWGKVSKESHNSISGMMECFIYEEKYELYTTVNLIMLSY